MRADSYLHQTRIFKTRSLASQACQRGYVRISGNSIKASRELKPGDVLDIRRGELNMVVRVINFPKQRISAPQVAEFLENLTPIANFEAAAQARKERVTQSIYLAGSKPDKKQMRQIRAWMDIQNQAE